MTKLPQALEMLGLDRRFAVDVLSVARGVRRVGLLHASLPSESGLREILLSQGLAVFARRELIRQDDPDSREGVLRDPAYCEVANFIELWYARSGDNALPPPAALFANPGTYLGYPVCCVSKWERRSSQRDLYRHYIFETTGGHWELNRLATFFAPGLLIPDFFPCSLSCESARAFASPFVELAREVLDPTWVHKTVMWMKAPLLERAGTLYAFPTWSLNGSELELTAADAARVPLATVGKFSNVVRPGCRMLSFRHLVGAERMNLVRADGTRTAIILDRN